MASVGFNGRRNHQEVNAWLAHTAGVKGAVRDIGQEKQAIAEALFAPHNHPARHEIEGAMFDTDYIVSLVGPAAVTVEYGREGGTDRSGRKKGPMQGLHILGRAFGL
jgi:hypothetical protein